MGVGTQAEIARELIDPQIPLGLLGAMTTDTVRLQKDLKRRGGVADTGYAKAGDEDG